MLKIISGSSVKQLDADYIKHKPISSHELMERAALAFCDWFREAYGTEKRVAIFCGIGNNGGDGLAVSRLLWQKGYSVVAYIVGDETKASADFRKNLSLLPNHLPLKRIHGSVDLGNSCDVVIDGMLGVGINRPLSGELLKIVEYLNALPLERIAIDIPTGLPSDDIAFGEAIKAEVTISFQFPKFSLMLPENASYTGRLIVADIGVEASYFEVFDSNRYYLEAWDISSRHKTFHRFSHKGDYGKVMLVGGSYGKIGAIRMASEAALRTGSGLVSCYLPQCGVDVLQVSLPEAMVEASDQERYLDEYLPDHIERFDAIGIGPGMGKHPQSAMLLEELLKNFKGPTVIDADGLNLLSEHRSYLAFLRENVILTPHFKEFERLAGPSKNHLERLEKAQGFVKKHGCVLVLKGAHTVINLPDGKQYFNSTGDQSLATGGSGDVLTGMITSFLGQGYAVEDAAICGVFHHGRAGELAGEISRRGTIATDIIRQIPKTFSLINVKG